MRGVKALNWGCCRYFTAGTLNTSLLVPSVDEQVSGALREPRQGGELDEARNGVTGEEILPTVLAAQDLSVRKQSVATWRLI